jgi:hypothetical protein
MYKEPILSHTQSQKSSESLLRQKLWRYITLSKSKLPKVKMLKKYRKCRIPLTLPDTPAGVR